MVAGFTPQHLGGGDHPRADHLNCLLLVKRVNLSVTSQGSAIARPSVLPVSAGIDIFWAEKAFAF